MHSGFTGKEMHGPQRLSGSLGPQAGSEGTNTLQQLRIAAFSISWITSPPAHRAPTMDNNTAAKIVRTILENAPREFYEQEAQARGEAGSWAEAKALAMFAMLTPAERAQALAPAPATPWGKDHDFTGAE